MVVVPLKPRQDNNLESSLAPLQKLVTDDLKMVNETIKHRLASDVSLIPELANHLIEGGGKRVRPMLTLAAARLCNYRGDHHILLAACVELIHTATLLHDDVVDDSKLRRGTITANALWGNQPSVLVGDFLFSSAFKLMVEARSLDILSILANASAVIAEGEVMQLLNSNNTGTTEDAYLQVVISKTAALFAAACQIGAVLANRPKAEEEALQSYGRNLGIAFQLVDDVLDFSASEGTFGKKVGDDFRDGKITLPVVLAYRRGSEDERNFWKRCLVEGSQEPEDLDKAQSILKEHNTLSDTLFRARHYGDIARDALAIFPPSEEKNAFLSVIDFCVSREY